MLIIISGFGKKMLYLIFEITISKNEPPKR